jgi:hypothetical protein
LQFAVKGSRLKQVKKRLCAAAAVLMLSATRVPAHHAFASEYDVNRVVTVSGAVTGFTWTNPHAWLYVNGADESGKAAPWSFEMGSPNGLLHRGWKRADLKEGDLITIDGYLAKDGRNVANARDVTLPDGRTLFGGFGSTPRAPAKPER